LFGTDWFTQGMLLTIPMLIVGIILIIIGLKSTNA
jgi:hypothetical protein